MGNKCDKVAERKVSKERAQTWAARVKADFFETSAKDLTGVEESFMKSLDLIMNKQITEANELEIDRKKDINSVTLVKKNNTTKDSCC